MGLTLIVDAPPRYARLETLTGETLSIHHADIVTSMTIIYFKCDNLDAKVHDLARTGIMIDQPPRMETWLWREARLRDPAGNAICLYTAGENRRFPPWRVPTQL